jgi:hypothetical protein
MEAAKQGLTPAFQGSPISAQRPSLHAAWTLASVPALVSREGEPNLMQINVRGRILQVEFTAPSDLLSTEEFRQPGKIVDVLMVGRAGRSPASRGTERKPKIQR